MTKQQAKKFLNNISKKDNVAIIHHNDGDGFCSAILFNDHCIKKGAKTKTFAYDLDKTSLKKLPLKKFNKIIITDISTKSTKEEIKFIKNKKIFYTDHHPKYSLPKKVIQLITTKKYTPSSKTTYELVGGKKWLALIGIISDSADFYKENIKYIKDSLKELNISLENFKKEYVYPLSNTIICLKKNPQKIFKKLSKINSLKELSRFEKYSKKIEKEIEKYSKKYKKKKERHKNVIFFYYKSRYPISKPLSNIISRKNPEKICILLTPDKKMIKINARHQSNNANLPRLLEKATKNFKDSICGGHPRASGGQILKKDLKKFKENIKKLTEK